MSSVVSDIGDVFEEAVDFVEDVGEGIVDAAEAVGEGIADAARWTAQAAKDVGKFLDDATSKDGWLTNFVQDYIPVIGRIGSNGLVDASFGTNGTTKTHVGPHS